MVVRGQVAVTEWRESTYVFMEGWWDELYTTAASRADVEDKLTIRPLNGGK